MNDILTKHSGETHSFVQSVQERAGIETYAEGYQLSRGVLYALGTAISGGEAKRLAEWVPPDLYDELAQQTGHANAFDKTNFLEKVAGQIRSVDLDSVEAQTGAVLQVLRSAAPAGELDDTIEQLPPALAAMFR